MRKSPKQDRARRTVGFILDAAAYILAERGLEGFTTNHVAERAGVNVGSVYQYFPNKAAILEALQARHVGKPALVEAHWWDAIKGLSLREVLRLIIEGALAEHAENPALHRTLLMSLPKSARRSAPPDRLARLNDLLISKSRASENPDMMMFIARHALLAAIDEAVCTRPEWLKDPGFQDELVRLLARYLEPEAEP